MQMLELPLPLTMGKAVCYSMQSLGDLARRADFLDAAHSIPKSSPTDAHLPV